MAVDGTSEGAAAGAGAERGGAVTSARFLEMVSARRGHFRMESGYHSALWLDLDPLFADQARIAPYVARLVELIRPHGVDARVQRIYGGANEIMKEIIARSL